MVSAGRKRNSSKEVAPVLSDRRRRSPNPSVCPWVYQLANDVGG
jgi:hypothetical protein